MTTILRTALLPSLLLSCSLLVACDWVDSAGTPSLDTRSELFLDDAPIGSAVLVQEQSTVLIAESRTTSNTGDLSYEWSSSPIDEGLLPTCLNQDGFIEDVAAASLADACTSPTDCSIAISQIDSSTDIVEFSLRAPQLKASVGLRFGLEVRDSRGLVGSRELDFCLIAINEAPVALDDTFVVREGVREIFPSSSQNLLTNDSDDNDDSNTEFVVLTTPAAAPVHAAYFELRPDGSFVYESNLTGILTDALDSFEYTLSDGVFNSTATVTLRIVTSNQAPELIDPIPRLEATVGDRFFENLSLYFSDPEEGSLSFSLATESSQLTGSNLTLLSSGILSGAPVEDAIGTYSLVLEVSDGGRSIFAPFSLTINESDEVSNSAPVYQEDTVFDQTLFLGNSIQALSPVFNDADGDLLIYSMADDDELPEGLTLNSRTGFIFGRPLERVWARNLRVEATDPDGTSAESEAFFIRVR